MRSILRRAARRRPPRGSLGALFVALLVGLGCGGSAADPGGTTGSGGGSGMTGAGSGGATTSGGSGGHGGAAPPAPLVAVELAVGKAHSCALVAGGTVACWGAGDVGQLGDGLSGKDHHRTKPATIAGLEGVKAIRAGGNTTCALVGPGGDVVCWGAGAYGQLGNGKAMDQYFEAAPVAVVGLEGAVDLSVSGVNACAVLGEGTVRCWGQNDGAEWLGFASPDCGPYLQKDGNGDPVPVTVPCETTPKEVSPLVDALEISVGGAHACALRAGGAVSCWGADGFGQLGDGTFGPGNHLSVPTAIPDLLGAQHVEAGSAHTCALLGNQKLACWGDNAHGQLGSGTDALDSYKTSPTVVPGLSPVIAFNVAGRTACAVTDDRLVHCWGDAAELFQTLPDPTKQSVLSPTVIADLAFVIEVWAGPSHACARKATNEAVCWGANESGQAGNGGTKAHDFSFAPVMF